MPQTNTLNKFLTSARLMGYTLPGSPGDVHVVGVSGGADSSVLCLLLSLLFPERELLLVFTDTQEEVAGTLESLRRIEKFTGRQFQRVAHADGLYGLIDAFGGFLPSSRSRYCTRILKTEAMEDYLEGLRGEGDQIFHNYVGLRADEPARTGLNSDMPWLKTHFPLRDLNIRREDVFAILDETVGIPDFYRFRSRSGCGICPFMRGSELLGTLEHHPDVFQKAESYEKLSGEDQARFIIDGADWSALPLPYPVPKAIDIRSAESFIRAQGAPVKLQRRRGPNLDLFDQGEIDLYVGVEYFVEPLLAMFKGPATGSCGVTEMRLVSFSRSRGGIARKLNTHYRTRLDTAEVFGYTQEDFRDHYRLAVFHLEMDAGSIDLDGTTGGSYTWRKDEPLAQLRMVVNAVKQLLYRTGLQQQMREYRGYLKQLLDEDPNLQDEPWEALQFMQIRETLKALPNPKGKILAVEEFKASEIPIMIRQGGDGPCFVCSK